MKKIKVRKFFIILVLIVLLGFVFTLILDTLSYFNGNFTANGNVSTAIFEDFIKKVSIVTSNRTYDNPNQVITNPQKIILTKADDLNCEPIVYFQVEGEISKYILHINPLRLDKKVNEREIKVGNKPNHDIKGKIHIKYLNEYFVKTYEIKIDKNCSTNIQTDIETLISSMEPKSLGHSSILNECINEGDDSINLKNECKLDENEEQKIIEIEINEEF